MITTAHRITVAAGVLAAALGIPAVGAAHADPVAQVQEDQPGWDCRTMGNRVCGPDNSQGLAAACYNDRAEVVAVWPCHVVVNPDGSSDVYEG